MRSMLENPTLSGSCETFKEDATGSTDKKVAPSVNRKKPHCYLYEDWLSGNSKERSVGERSAPTYGDSCVHACPAARVYGKLAGSDMTYHLSGESTAMFSLLFLWIHTQWPDNIRESGPTHFASKASRQRAAGSGLLNTIQHNIQLFCFVDYGKSFAL